LNSGYYAACAGLKAQTQALELVANNLANVNTNGYLGQQPTFRSLVALKFAVPAGGLNAAINSFNVLGGTRLDLSQGNLQQTGNPLDLAIEGNGFFVAKTQFGNLYTRNGSFRASPQGQLTTVDGDPVMDAVNLPIFLPAGHVSVSADGTISVQGAVVAKLRIVEFLPDATPTPVGSSYYDLPDNGVRPATVAAVRQGMVEASNVNPVGGVMDLIIVQRHADMLQRALSSYYSDFNRIAAGDLPKV
jgi:flagellar basal-body rod protein FlgF